MHDLATAGLWLRQRPPALSSPPPLLCFARRGSLDAGLRFVYCRTAADWCVNR